MHLNRGDIRTYQDGELSLAERQRVEAHLAACAACRAEAEALNAQAQRVSSHLRSLQPAQPATHPLPLRTARHRLEQRINSDNQEKQTMLNKLLNRISRPAWAAITLVAVLAVALAFPSVRAMAGDLLRLFRVEQVRVVEIDTANMDRPGQMENSANLEAFFADNVKFEKAGEPQEVSDVASAEAQTGLDLRLPTSLGDPASILVQPGGKMSFTIDRELLQAVLKDLGETNYQLPENLDGRTVNVELLASAAAMYGDCPKLDEKEMRGKHGDPTDPDDQSGADGQAAPDGQAEPDFKMPNCTTFMQVPSPKVEAPEELDVNQLGQVYLQLLGMTPDEAAQFASSVDWTTTFVIPVPRYSTQQKEVAVDGTTGTLIRFREAGDQAYALLWVKDGVVYAISGPGDGQTALDIAGSMK